MGGDGKDSYRVGLADGDSRDPSKNADRNVAATTEGTVTLDAGLAMQDEEKATAKEEEKSIDNLRRRQEATKADLAWAYGLLAFAVLEHVNYYHYQLMYDTRAAFASLRRNGRLRKAALGLDLQRQAAA